MGASNSSPAKDVTLEEDEVTGTIKVTEAVAKRLTGQESDDDSSVQSDSISKEEINKLENHYEARIRSLELKNDELYQTTTEQFANAVDEVEKKFVTVVSSPICEEEQQKVLKCYSENPGQVLLCSDLVKTFNECVNSYRKKVLVK